MDWPVRKVFKPRNVALVAVDGGPPLIMDLDKDDPPMTAHDAKDITEANAAVADLEKFDWNLTPAYVADTGDGGHYRVIELPDTLGLELRFVAVRSRLDDRGKLWEYMVGRFRTLNNALSHCWLDYKS